jgi:hypothetical protein
VVVSRRGTLIAALAAVLLVVVAVMVGRSSTAPPPAQTAPDPSTTATSTSSTSTSTPPRLPPDPGGGAAAVSGEVQRTYTLPDGTRVRDHRVNPAEPFAIPSTPPQRRVVPMKSDEVARVHAQLRPMTDACTAPVPAAEVGAGASVLVRLLVTVDDGRLVVDEATATAKGLGERAAAVETCIRERAGSIQMATGHAAMQRYPLTFPYRVRR